MKFAFHTQHHKARDNEIAMFNLFAKILISFYNFNAMVD